MVKIHLKPETIKLIWKTLRSDASIYSLFRKHLTDAQTKEKTLELAISTLYDVPNIRIEKLPSEIRHYYLTFDHEGGALKFIQSIVTTINQALEILPSNSAAHSELNEQKQEIISSILVEEMPRGEASSSWSANWPIFFAPRPAPHQQPVSSQYQIQSGQYNFTGQSNPAPA